MAKVSKVGQKNVLRDKAENKCKLLFVCEPSVLFIEYGNTCDSSMWVEDSPLHFILLLTLD